MPEQDMTVPTPPKVRKLHLDQDSESDQDFTYLNQQDPHQPKTKPSFFSQHPKLVKGLLIAVGVILVLIIALGIYTWQVATKLQAHGVEMKIAAQAAYTNFKNQDLPATEVELSKLETQEAAFRQTYAKLGIYNYLPIARRYYQDGLHGLNAAEAGLRAGQKSLEAITPYADVLGFAGEGSFEGGTAEDRLKLVLETLDKISPVMDEINKELETTQSELATIDPQRYPENVRDLPIRSYIVQAQDYSQLADSTLTQYRPIIEQLPSIMGARGERQKYLLLFQNDNELRPTGGFLTAYAVIYIEDGKVTPEKSDDIYELDQKFNKRIPIPDALGRYLTTEKYWNLRDMNINPDFKESMDVFLEHYREVPGEPDNLSGIIAVDTEVLTDILAVLGPVEVPGYGTFSAENDPRCDCPQVVYALSEIITKPTPYLREDRKGILGPMMGSLLTKAYAAPKQQWPQVFQVAITSLERRDTQLYFFDETNQQAAEAINAAGRMTPPENTDTDFLAIVNANLGGAKSNLFTSYDVLQVVESPENGLITKTVEITYRNSRKADNCNLEAGQLCLNSTLRDWTRLYLPAGSQLIDAQGFTEEAKEYEENGFHVIDGFFILEPNSQAKLKLTYTVPYSDGDTYRVQLWKQGGIDPVETVMEVTGGQEKVLIDKDITYETPF